MSVFTSFILGFILGVSIVGLVFYMMYSGESDDTPEDEFDDEEEEL